MSASRCDQELDQKHDKGGEKEIFNDYLLLQAIQAHDHRGTSLGFDSLVKKAAMLDFRRNPMGVTREGSNLQRAS